MCRIRRLKAARGALAGLGSPGQAVTLLRLEGIAASVAHRAAALAERLRHSGRRNLSRMRRRPRCGARFATSRRSRPAARWARGRCGGSSVRRPPAARFGQALARDTGGEVIYDWGGGLIWAALPPTADAHAALLRQRLAAARRPRHLAARRRGDAAQRSMCFIRRQRASPRWRERVRQSFDPKSILNRGRLTRRTIST